MLAKTKRVATRTGRINGNYFSKNIMLQWFSWKRLEYINIEEKFGNMKSVLDLRPTVWTFLLMLFIKQEN